MPLVSVVGWPVVLASLSLVILAVGLSRWLRLGIERDMIIASIRAAVQLLAVGVVFAAIFRSDQAWLWSWVWVVFMALVATRVVVRRAEHTIRNLALVAGLAVFGSAAISIAITFGLGVLDYDPVALVVIAGITIGNAVPSAVLAAKQSMMLCRDHLGDLEAGLALGFTRRDAARFMAPRAAKAAMITRIERTKVVGLIALPGAMTGLLLAGVDPIEAVAV
ncbi:MAG TPA: ABC transporter permease, partial [Actinobacteria bacterium]|nr:ABC transporter permease [Actinomycetota bacterium]